MGQISRRNRHWLAVAAAMALGVAADRAGAANQYWDTNDTASGAGSATPAGTWGVDNFWNPSPAGTGSSAAWTANETAVFAAGTDATGAYAVTVSGTQDVGGLRFEEGSVTLSSGTIRLTTNTVVVSANNGASSNTIDSIITGTVGLSLARVGSTGTASLALGGNSNYTGATEIVGGNNNAVIGLTLNHNSALGATGAGNGTAFLTTGSNSTFIALPGNRIINEDLTITGGATSGVANGQLRATGGVNTWAGNIIINGTVNSLGTGLAGLGASSGTLVITGSISNVGTGANTAGVVWAKTGAGTLVLRSSNTNVGFTRAFHGNLVIEADGALGTPTVDGSFDGATLSTTQSNSTPTIAFNSNSGGFSYNVHENITTAGAAAQNGLGNGSFAMLDNFGGANTFTGNVRLGGTSVTGPTRILTSLGAQAGSSLELSGGLYASASGAGTTPTTPDAREIHKVGGGNLIISGANDTTDGVTSGDADMYRLHGEFVIDAGTVTLRSSNASGGVLLGNSVGPMNFKVNSGTTLALDNSLAANNSRLASNAVVTVSGGELQLVGNASTSVTQTLSNPSVTGNSTITVSQPTSGNGSTTTLRVAPSTLVTMRATTLNLSTGAKLDLTDNKLIVAGQLPGTWNGSAYTGITGLVQSGLGNGSWNGEGIVTSMTTATTSVLTTLAVGEASELGYAGGTFGGVSVSAGDTIVFYTWGGDADLNGELNGDDYFWIDSYAPQNGFVFGYHYGDFNYDGAIDGDDYFILDSNILQAQGSGFVFPHGAGARGLTAVPEPGAVGVGIAALVLHALSRKRRPTRE